MATEKSEKTLRGEAVWPAVPPEFRPIAPLLPASPIPSLRRAGESLSVTLTNGKTTKAIEFFPEAAASDHSDLAELDPPDTLDKLIERLRPLGQIDRRDAPELLNQLHEAKSRPVDTVICSVLDADSTLRINGAIAAHQAGDMVNAVKLLMKLTAAKRGIIAVESGAPPAWATPVREAVVRARLEWIDLENDYPQADPTLLVYSLTRRRLKPASLPPAQGAIVLDAAAAVGLWRSIKGIQAGQTPVGIHDHRTGHSHFLQVPTGTVLADLLDAIGIREIQITLRGGDLLRDVRLPREAVLGGAEPAIHISEAELPINPDPCIRCGWCMEACPTLVQPANLLEAAQRHDFRIAERAGLGACIQCGLCTYVCPSNLPLLESIQYLKRETPAGGDPRRWKR